MTMQEATAVFALSEKTLRQYARAARAHSKNREGRVVIRGGVLEDYLRVVKPEAVAGIDIDQRLAELREVTTGATGGGPAVIEAEIEDEVEDEPAPVDQPAALARFIRQNALALASTPEVQALLEPKIRQELRREKSLTIIILAALFVLAVGGGTWLWQALAAAGARAAERSAQIAGLTADRQELAGAAAELRRQLQAEQAAAANLAADLAGAEAQATAEAAALREQLAEKQARIAELAEQAAALQNYLIRYLEQKRLDDPCGVG